MKAKNTVKHRVTELGPHHGWLPLTGSPGSHRDRREDGLRGPQHRGAVTQSPFIAKGVQGGWGLRSCPVLGTSEFWASKRSLQTCAEEQLTVQQVASGYCQPITDSAPATLPVSRGSAILPAVTPEASVVPDLSSCHLTSGHQHILLAGQETARTMDHPVSIPLDTNESRPLHPSRKISKACPHFCPLLFLHLLLQPEQRHMLPRLQTVAPVLFQVEAREPLLTQGPDPIVTDISHCSAVEHTAGPAQASLKDLQHTSAPNTS